MKTRNRNIAQLLSGLLFALVSTTSAAQAKTVSAAQTSNSSVVELINARLGHMKSVAAYKWLNDIPIEDLEREAKVLETAANDGLRAHIQISASTAFFSLQIQAAKEIQQYWFDQWRTQGIQPASPDDLNTIVRPALLRLGSLIIKELVAEDTINSLTSEKIRAEGLSNQTAQQLTQAALDIKQYSHTLQQVVQSGTLRVGITLDYKPFSYEHTTSGLPYGIDVDLAKDLATSLGVKLQFVQTSWPTLMQDLADGLFDIGMSGISINLKRHKTAFFSNPYHTGGKSPIIRCEDKKRYPSLSAIDQKDVRLIVNPGGTNEKFVQSTIKKAKVKLHPDNRTIFAEIMANRADVMITDAIEVSVQSHLHPLLCAAMPDETLTFSQKAFLLPQDMTWKLYVDSWLAQRKGDGTLQATFNHHLAR